MKKTRERDSYALFRSLSRGDKQAGPYLWGQIHARGGLTPCRFWAFCLGDGPCWEYFLSCAHIQTAKKGSPSPPHHAILIQQHTKTRQEIWIHLQKVALMPPVQKQAQREQTKHFWPTQCKLLFTVNSPITKSYCDDGSGWLRSHPLTEFWV